MKNYEEVTESVFRKSDEIIKRNKRRRNTMMKIGMSAGCLIVVGAVGVSVWANGNKIPTESSGQFISDSAALAFGASDTVYNGAFVGDSSSRLDGNGGLAEKIPKDPVTGNDMIILSPHNGDPNFHLTTVIGGFKTEDDERKIAPANGQIHISKSLNAAMEHYGDVDENGNEIQYGVIIEYLQDQQIIDPTDELFESERERLKEPLGLDMVGDIGLETRSCDWGAHSEHGIFAHFTKAQIEKFTANPDYGYVIELYDNYNGFQTNTNCGIIYGHNTAPVETVQSTESTVKQSEISSTQSTVTGNSTGEKSGVAEKIPEVTIGGNMPIMTADSDNSFLFNFPAQIDGFKVEDNEMKVAPDNGQIHISKALNAAMEHYGDVDENGEITYRVVITYLQNRQTIESTRELYNSECARLKEQCGLFGLNLETTYFDWGARYENHICAHLTKSEIERFTANPDYGYAIDLYVNYFDLPISNELVIH